MKELTELFNTAVDESAKFSNGNKSAGARMRKALLAFEKKSKLVRKESLK